MTDLPVAGGTERVLFLHAQNPRATMILLVGGDGLFQVDQNGHVTHSRNFLVRTRHLWVAQGFNVVLPVPANYQSLIGRRTSSSYMDEMSRVVNFARSRSPVRVWVVGTSQGTTGAMGVAARVPGVSGLILTSSVTGHNRSHETVFDNHPENVQVPALVVANAGDTCMATPPGDANRILAAMSRSPRKQVLVFESHEARSPPCKAMSPHGYLGIEAEVIQRISDWVSGR